jgi:hypothetical protein
MENRKKMIAAISAVMGYLQEEEAALSMQLAAAEMVPPRISSTLAPPSLWGVSGRQSQMQLRNLMQLRTFTR